MNCYATVSWFLLCFAFGSYLLFPRIYQLGWDAPEIQRPRIILKLPRSMLMASTCTVRASQIQSIVGILDETSEEVVPQGPKIAR